MSIKKGKTVKIKAFFTTKGMNQSQKINIGTKYCVEKLLKMFGFYI